MHFSDHLLSRVRQRYVRPRRPDKSISPGCESCARAPRRRPSSPLTVVGGGRCVTDVRPLQVSAPYRRLFFGNTVAQLGQQMTNVAVAIQVYALTHSSFYVGLVGVFALVPLVALGLYGGAIADAVDRRTLALVASAGLWAVSIALAVQAFCGQRVGVAALRLHRGAVGLLRGQQPGPQRDGAAAARPGADPGGQRAEHGVVQPRLHLRPGARRAGDRVAGVRGGVRHRRGHVRRRLLRAGADAADAAAGEQPARRAAVGASTGCGSSGARPTCG